MTRLRRYFEQLWRWATPAAARAAVAEECEPRILYSAEANPLLWGADGAPASAIVGAVDPLPVAAMPQGPTVQHAGQAERQRHEIVFVDAAVPDAKTLVDGVIASRPAGTTIDVITLEAGADGLAQISAALAGQQGVAALHILSHGDDGVVQLGNARVDGATLQQRSDEIAAWRAGLSDSADLMLYGCDVGAGTAGAAFVEQLARLTGADVAASTDATGASALGGNWMLEARTGSIEARVAIGVEAQNDWSALLAITTGTTTSADTTTSGASSLTFSHTVGAGSNAILIVEIASKAGTAAVTSVTYGGTALTFLGASEYSGGDDTRAEMWTLKAPATGTANIVINMSASSAFAASATHFFGVDQTTPTGSVAADSNSDSTPSVTLASAAGELVIDSLAVRAAANGTGSVGANQTQLFQRSTGGGGSDQFASGSWEAGAPSVTMSWTLGGNKEHAIFAVALQPATMAVAVTPTVGLVTTEGGGSASFQVVLNTAPTANVTVPVSSSDSSEGTVSTSLLTFTTANWNVAQTVTVTGVNDQLDDGNIAFNIITGAAVSGDAAYNGLAVSDVAVTNTDDDTYNTVVVTNTTDTVNGSTASIAALAANDGGDGISLREAITAANATANGSSADRITFDIAGSGVHMITPLTSLPTFTDVVILDASTDDSFAANGNKPAIILDGNDLPGDGLVLSNVADGSTIRGLVIRNFGQYGILIDTGSDGNTIAGNYIGNLTTSGVFAGAGLGNTNDGIRVNGANNMIGGLLAADRNIISGNAEDGIGFVGASATGNTVSNNYIGTDVTGTVDVGQVDDGIDFDSGANGNFVAGNLISGNDADGIDVNNASGNRITGNYIGTNAAGTAALGNATEGIRLAGSSSNNTIGGSSAADRNIVSGNGDDGIDINDAGTLNNVVQGNYIGTDVSGTLAVGNANDGIDLDGTAGPVLIGGSAAGQGNLIAFNGQRGITLQGSAGGGVAILGNRIHSNSSLGIDLGNNGVTANDIPANMDSDTGPNNLQNFPVLTRAVTNASNRLAVGGTLNSIANTVYRIEVFSNIAGDGSNFGEGQTYLGFVNVRTDGSGNATWGTAISANVAVGAVISATATRLDAALNPVETSEFAGNVTTVSQTLIVTNTTDVINGTITSVTALIATPGGDGISLREAITAANNDTTGIDLILFNIAGVGPHTINTATALPAIGGSLVIDGTTEPDYSAGTPVVGVDGAAAGFSGINIAASGAGSTIRGLMITGFTLDGINVASNANNVTIADNWIGTAGTGTSGHGNAAVGNTDDGIDITGSNALILRNVITNNFDEGIDIVGSGVTGHVIQGNIIGLDPDGATSDIGNNDVGIAIISGTGNFIGGTSAAARNVISMNNEGIEISTSNNVVQGNYIGTAASGTANRGNRIGHGVQIQGSSTNNQVGGTAAGAGNLIAYNFSNGVDVVNGSGTQILGNAIHSNTLLGINLGTAGVTNNDGNDADTGANNLQNFPVLTSAAADGSQVVISGSLNGEASKTYRIEFFANTANDNEGQRYLGYTTVTTPAGSPYTVSFSATLSAAVTGGEYITATATDPTNNTSEFSAQVAAASGMGIWANNNTTPVFAQWNGSGFGATANSQTTGEWAQIRIVEAPTRNEIIAVGVNTAGVINGQIWNGSTWTAFSFNDLVDLSTTGFKSFQLAYGQQSGVAMLVWDNGSTGTASLSYRTWNGTSWSAAQTITTPVAGEAVQLSLAADPNGDSMVLAVSGTPAANDYALVWNGTSWGNAVTLDTTTGIDRTEIQVAYEAHSGRAMVVYDADGSTNAINYRTWDGTSWSAQQSLSAPAGIGAGNDANFSVMASDPNSDRIALAVITDSSEIWISVWDGTAWSSQVAATTAAAITTAPVVGLAFEHDSGDLLAAYGKNGSNNVFYRTWTSGAGWSSEATGPNVGGVPNSVLLYADPNSNRIMLGVHDGLQDVNFVEWTGSTWNAVSGDMTSNTGTSGGFAPLGFVWYDNNRTPVIGTSGLSVAENTALAGTVVASDADGDARNYSIIAGADQALFSIDSGTGALSFVAAPNFEVPTDAGANNVYDVIVRVSDGNGGTDSQSVAVTVTNVNEAPTLDTSRSPALNAVLEDAGVPTGAQGTLVSALVDFASPTGQVDNVTDPDSGAVLGIAVTAADTANGQWFYTIDGTNWNNLGALSDADARLLAADANTRLYFLPNPNYNGTLAGAITFRAWDQTSGSNGALANASTSGGATAFSAATDSASLIVNAVNDQPVNTAASGQYTPFNTALVFSSTNGNQIGIADADAAASPVQVTLTVGNGTLTLAGTAGLTITGGANGSATMAFTGSVASINTALNGLTYSATTNFRGLDTLQIATSDLGNTGAGGTLTDTDSIKLYAGALVVTTTSDASNGTTASINALAANDGGDGISLREAIIAANNTAGADTIHFNIAGTGVHTIAPTAALPTITGTVTIDASTDDSFAANGNRPAIVLDGNDGNFAGLVIGATGDGSTITGLVIRDFGSYGLHIAINADGNTIVGNYIGALSAGGVSAGAGENNGDAGIYVRGSNNTIGGASPALRNVISGNSRGIFVLNASSNTIQGNFIGTDAAGTTLIGNFGEGIQLRGATNTQIGGTAANAGNVLAGAEWEGIWLWEGTTGTVVEGNFIGTDITGTLNLGNVASGINIGNFGPPSTGNRIGGTAAGAANLIAFNGRSGVEVDQNAAGPSTGNPILGNRFYANAGIAIDLDGPDADPSSAGVTANDAGDADVGGNNRQNFPVLSAARTTGAQVTFTGTLNSTASTQYRIEFFASTAQDGTGYGEGQRYLGFTDVTTDGSGNAAISDTFTATVAAGEFMSATATRINAGVFTDTSEFAQNLIATIAPVVTTSGATLAYTENGVATAADNALTVTDADSINLTGATITVSANYANGQDVLAFTDQLGISGSWIAGTGVLTLSGTTTVANYQTALRSVTYVNSGDNPSTLTRTVAFVVNDGTASSTAATRNISVTAVNDAPAITNLAGDALAYAEGNGAVVIEQGGNATVADLDSADFNTGNLTVSFTAGSDGAEDVLGIRNEGSGAGQIGVSGANVTYGGITIGSFAGGSGGANLVTSFTGPSSPAAAQALIRNITFQDTDTSAPTTGARTVRFVLSDGDGGSSGSHDSTVTVSAVNDAPVATITPASYAATEQVALTLKNTGLSLADVDAAAGSMTVTLSVTEGTLTVTAGGSGALVSNSGTSSVTITGTVTQINNLLSTDATSTVSYTDNTDAPSASATLTLLVDDNGNTGGGSLSNADTATINITAVNDAPVITSNGGGANASVGVAENSTAVTTVTSTDVDGGAASYSILAGGDAARFTINPGTGVLTFITAPDYENPADGGGDNTYGLTVQVSDGAGGTATQGITVTVTNVADGIRVTPISVVPIGGETLVNTNTTDIQSIMPNVMQAVAVDANGNYVVVWASNLQDGALYGIYAQRFSADGTALGAEFRVNTTTADTQILPAVAMDSAGNFTVAWTSNLQDGSGFGVYAQRYNAAGVAQGGEFLVNTTTAASQSGPSIAMSSTGAFVITWTSGGQDPDTSSGIYAQRFDASGVAQGGEFRVNTYTIDIQQIPSVAMDASGNFVVTWVSNLQDGSGYGVYGQRYSAGGVAQSAEFRVNTTTADSQLYHDVAMLEDGRFVVAYQSRTGANYEVYVQRYAANGMAIGGETRVNTTTVASYQPIPSISADADGNLTVVWNSPADGGFVGVVGRRLDWSSAAIGGEFQVNTTTAGDQLYPEVVAQAGGRFLVAWAGNGAGDAYGIFTQRYGLVTTEAGGTASFDVMLEAAPTGDVVISVSVPDGTEGTVSAASLTFTTANWNIAQTVTVTGVQDFSNDGDTTFTVVLGTATSTDLNFSGLNPTDLSVVNREVANVAPVNTVPTAQTVNEDTALVFSAANGNAITVSDADAGTTNAMQVTLSVTNGVLTLSGVAGLSFSSGANGSATMTFTGTIASINTALNGLRFDPTADFNGAATLTLNTNDQGNTGTGGALSDNDTVAITVSAVNDAPSATNLNAAETYTEDTPLNLADIVISDVDSVSVTATLTLSNTAAGSLNTGTSGAVTSTYNAGTGVWTASGAIADVNTLLAAGTFTPATNFNSAFTIATSVSDGVAAPVTGSKAMTGSAVNDTPVLAAIGNQSVNEGATLSFTASATDADLPAQTLTYSLDGASIALGMSINASTGVFSWTPSEAQGGLTPAVTVTVTDNGTGSLTDSETFTVTVGDTNVAPVLAVVGDRSVNEGAALTFTASATDADLPSQTLTYSLDGSSIALGMTINSATGVFSWTPTEAQGGLAPSVTVTVTDNGSGNLSDSETFTITVADLNTAPVLAVIGDRSINEGATLSFTASATDSDLPSQTLSYSLDAGSLALGMTINASSGVFSWTPTEAQGGLTPSVTVTVTDNGSGTLTDSETFTVTVGDTNVAPVLAVVGDRSINEGATLSFTASATDADLPSQTLSYSLDGGSIALGMTINSSSGAFSWTPTEAQGGLTPSVTVTVTDNGSGTLTDSETFTITVVDLNDAPVLAAIGNRSVDEGATLTFTATATDADLPSQTLSYSLDAGSLALGMTINASSGAFSWTPTEAQGALTPSVTVTVTDNGSGTLTDSETFAVTVVDLNDAPVLAAIGNRSVNEGATLTFTATATDADLPSQTLTYSLDGASIALGMSINASTGVFSWTPTESQGALTPSVTVTVTDNGSGTLTDSETFTITVGDTNLAPVLAVVGDRSINEGATLSFTASATDSDLPSQTLTYSLDGASLALGMTINASTGVFSWTPTEAQGGLTPSVTVTVTDNGSGTLTDSETFTITAADLNDAPVLAAIGNRSVDEGATLTFTASATDVDLPSQTLSYSLDAGSLALGMTINASSGVFSWTPTEAQGGLTPSVTVTVTDNGSGNLSDSETITITVADLNDAPVLAAIGNRSVNEGATLSFTVSATDSDLPSQTLSYSLDAGSLALGMTINASSGAFSWSPTEAQGGTAPSVTVTVTDNGTGSLTDSETFTVTVGDTNLAPVLAVIGDRSVNEGAALTFTASATDADLPSQTLSYSLDAGSLALGMTINASSGAFSWTPTEAQGGLTPSVTVTVTDNGSGSLTDSETFTITVGDTNQAPVLAAIGDRSVNEGATLTFTATATDSDLPGQTLSYSLDAGSLALGMTINASTGVFSWTPTEAQGGLTPSVTVTVTDNGSGTLTDSETFTITVADLNDAPVLAAIGDRSVNEGATLSFTVSATDTDLPSQTLSYSLDAGSLALGMTINSSSGAFSWTPTEAQGGTAPSVTVTVTDNGTGNLSDSETFTVTVADLNDAPELAAIGNRSVNEGATLSFTASATDTDLPGQTLSYSLDAGSLALGMTINASSGAFSWTPTEAQGGTAPSVTVTVTDNGTGNLSDSETFTVTVADLNDAPVLAAIGNRSVDEGATLSFTASATDADLPSQTLSYSLDAGSLALGMTINSSSGAFSWTPTEAQGGTAPSVTVTVTDNGSGTLTDSETFTITVGDTNVAPVLAAIGDRSVNEGATLSFTASATDADLPSQTLSYSLDAGSLALGMTINASSGAFSWTPTEAQGGTAPSVTVTVTDNGTGNLSDSETFTVTAADLNDAPVLAAIGNRSVNEGATLSFTASATDADLPSQTLSYSLDAGSLALGMTINSSSGGFSWTPTEAQGGTAPSVTVTVTDNGSGTLTDSETFTVAVADLNDAPVLAAIGNRSVNEGATLSFTATATDSDLPSQTLSYSLDAASLALGMTINSSSGAFSWSPTEAQGGLTPSVTLTVTDNGSGTLTDSETFTVTVADLNDAPALAAIGNRSVNEGATLSFAAIATDADLPSQALSYALDGASIALGMTINASSGAFSWTPSEAQGGTAPSVTVTVTDSGTGTLTDSETFTITVADLNDAPVLAAIGDRSVNEGATLSFIASATDSDLPSQTLTYSLDGASLALGMTINASTGVFSWTPSEAQGGLTPAVTVTVTDNGTGNLSDSETFTITVADLNDAPVLSAIGNRSVNEGATLSFTAIATDVDLPSQTLTYSLDGASIALGMAINSATGVFSWTPTEAQGGLAPSVTVTVTDNGSGNLSDSEAFTITVGDTNLAPVLAAIGNRSVNEGATLTFTASATDGDLPSQTLSYSLDAGSLALGMTINSSSGAFSWTPTEAQGGLTPSVAVTVTDNGSGSLTDSETITVTVGDTNLAPVLAAIGNRSVNEGATLTFTASATDGDLPSQTLSYSLDAGSLALGMSINSSSGAFSWTPTEAQGGTAPSVTVTVTDNGSGTLTDSETFTVTVADLNDAPVLAAIGNRSVNEGAALSFTASATDSDLPSQALTYSLDGASIALGMTINSSSGAFSWTPTEAQGGLTPSVTVTVTDNGSGSLTDSETFTITVGDTNQAPVLGAIGNRSVNEGATLSFTASATDTDLPGQTLSYSLDAGSLALGMTINASTGAFSWTPTEAQGGTAPSVTVTVTDNGTGSLTDGETFTVTAADLNDAPVLAAIGDRSVNEGAALSFTASATDSDLPSQALTYSLDGASIALGMTINASSGAFGWTPTEAQGGTAPSVTVTVADNGTGSLTDSETITITVADLNDAPVLSAIGNRSVNEGATLSFTASATDADLPSQTLSYSLDGASIALGMTINASSGVFSWTPTEAQGGTAPSVTVTVTDNGTGSLTDSETITITVDDTNQAPELGAIGNRSVNEDTTLSFTASATDADLPSQALTYSIGGGADADKFAIDASSGALIFTTSPNFEAPTDLGGNNVYEVTVQVADGNGGVDTEAVLITVINVNEAPVITSGGGLGTASVSAAENQTAVTTVTSADVDGGTAAYTITGGDDQALFSIDASSGVLTFITAPNFELPTDAGADNVYDLAVQVSDGMGGTDSQAIAVTLTNVVEVAPAITVGAISGTTTEAGGSATFAVVLEAAPTADVTISITTGDLSEGTVSAGLLTFTQANWNAPQTVTVTGVDDALDDGDIGFGIVTGPVTSSDANYNTIVVADVAVVNRDDDAPLIVVPASQLALEDTPLPISGVVVQDAGGGLTSVQLSVASGVISVDLAGGALVVGGSNGGASITLAGTHAQVNAALAALVYQGAADFNGADTLSLRATDGAGALASRAIPIVVVPVNDPALGAPLIIGLSTEDQTLTADVLGLADADGLGAFSYQWLRDGAPIAGATTTAYRLDDVDVGSRISLQVAYLDGQGTPESVSSLPTALVVNLNDAPVVSSFAGAAAVGLVIEENTTTVAIVSSTDVDGGAPTYALRNGADAAFFSVDAQTGALRFAAAPDFEVPQDSDADQVYDVTVTVSDGAGGQAEQTFLVRVANVDDTSAPAPTLPPPPPPPVLTPDSVPTPAPPPPADEAPPAPATDNQGAAEPVVSTTDNPSDEGSGEPAAPVLDGLTTAPVVAAPDDTRRPAQSDSVDAERRIAAATAPTAGGFQGVVVSFGLNLPVTPDFGLVAKTGFDLDWADARDQRGGEPGRPVLLTLHSDQGLESKTGRDTADSDAQSSIEQVLTDPTRVSAASLTVGFVWWLTRSGGLLAGVLMGVPAWRHVDLLPVLARRADDDDDDDDDGNGNGNGAGESESAHGQAPAGGAAAASALDAIFDRSPGWQAGWEEEAR